MRNNRRTALCIALLMITFTLTACRCGGGYRGEDAAEFPSHAELKAALKTVVDKKDNGGFNLQMWATIVDRDGVVVMVAFSGDHRGDQWPGSRVISAQKANTANAFSLPGLAISTAQLFSATQPGQSLFGLQFSNPVNPKVGYGGCPLYVGTEKDGMVGRRIGGVNVFGGGLALYTASGKLIGAIGVSGDASTADHNICWKLRDALKLDYVPGGLSPTGDDNMVNDISSGKSAGGWGHPSTSGACAKITAALPKSHPLSKVKK
jgi:uncharacterized protein GlcG (DUF336 family)